MPKRYINLNRAGGFVEGGEGPLWRRDQEGRGHDGQARARSTR
jgi:hypothetical protein